MNSRLVYFDVPQMVSGEVVNEPRLIMSDGTDVVLKKESNIRYSRNDEIIVDNQKLDLHKGDKTRPMVMQTVIPYGSRSKIILDDSTVVYLNAGSRIIHPSRFDGNKREVILFGEAFFEVTKNDKKPFVVKTSSLSIKVLGTRFNVSSYPEDNLIQTVVEEGSVSVKKNKSSIFEKEIVLKPNQLLSLNCKTGESRVVNINPDFYTLWRHGLLKFENQDLNRVVKKIERYYNIKIKFGAPLDGLVKISGKLDLNGSRKEVFEYLAFVSDLKIIEYGEDKYIIK